MIKYTEGTWECHTLIISLTHSEWNVILHLLRERDTHIDNEERQLVEKLCLSVTHGGQLSVAHEKLQLLRSVAKCCDWLRKKIMWSANPARALCFIIITVTVTGELHVWQERGVQFTAARHPTQTARHMKCEGRPFLLCKMKLSSRHKGCAVGKACCIVHAAAAEEANGRMMRIRSGAKISERKSTELGYQADSVHSVPWTVLVSRMWNRNGFKALSQNFLISMEIIILNSSAVSPFYRQLYSLFSHEQATIFTHSLGVLCRH